MRTVIVFASVLLLGAALADVRHVSVPEWLWGTWAPSAELCRDDKSIIVMSEKKLHDIASELHGSMAH